MTRRRRRLVATVAALAALAAALAAAARATTPPAAHLEQHVAQRLRGTGARIVPVAAVAPILARAVVATEDERFYRHHGIDLIGLARAIPYDVAHLSFAQGASTITEQVAKLLYLGGNDHNPWRKLQDMALAVKVENRYSKAQILAAYLNTAYFGAGSYGIAAASRRYFGVAPARLTLAQASLLAGLPQAPSAYDPLHHPAAARARQFEVLTSLVRVGAVTPARADAVLARPLPLRGARALPPLRGAAVSIGPPFGWADLAAGAVVALAGLAIFVLRRSRRVHARAVAHALAAVSALLLAFGLAVVLRSFRTM